MSKPVEIAAMVAQAVRELGSVDILVNNAGIQHVAPIEEFPPEKWDAVIAINLSAAFHAIRFALPHMKARNWERHRQHRLDARPGGIGAEAAYVAAKHGILGLTKVVALETATTGITCNAICPGWVLTPLVQKQIDDRAAREKLTPEAAKRKLLGEKQPSLEFATPQEIGCRGRVAEQLRIRLFDRSILGFTPLSSNVESGTQPQYGPKDRFGRSATVANRPTPAGRRSLEQPLNMPAQRRANPRRNLEYSI